MQQAPADVQHHEPLFKEFVFTDRGKTTVTNLQTSVEQQSNSQSCTTQQELPENAVPTRSESDHQANVLLKLQRFACPKSSHGP